MNGWAEFLAKLVQLLERLLPTLAAYFAGKSSAQNAGKTATLKDVERAKKVADRIDNLDDTDVRRLLSERWTRKPILPDSPADLPKSDG